MLLREREEIFHLSFVISHLSFDLDWLVSAIGGRFNPQGHREYLEIEEYVEIDLVSNDK